MDQNQISEEIKFIRGMIEKTKKTTAESWKFFSTWGIMIILAIIGHYTLAWLAMYDLIWVNWIAFMLIGVLFSIAYQRKCEKSQESQTYAQIAISHVSFACGIAIMLGGFVFPILKLYSYGVIPVVISMVIGVLLFTIGGIYEWSLLKWAALLWWAGSIVMIFVHWHYRALLCIPLIIFGYLVPGFILRSQYRKESA